MTNSSQGFNSSNSSGNTSSGNDALARYQYLLRTASPDQIEQAHEQAFAAMSASERQQVLQALSNAGVQTTDTSAASLARQATRLEVQQPGILQKVLGGVNSSGGRTLLGSLAVGMAGAGIYDLLFQNDGPGRPGLVSRLLGGGGAGLMGGGLLNGLFGRRNAGFGMQAPPPPMGGGMMGGLFGGRNEGGFGGPGGGPGGGFGGGPGGPGGGGFGGGPGGGGPGGGPGF